VNLVNLETAVKAYGPRVLLDGVSLGVSAGDRIGVVGRNGAGKTTLLAALAGAADLDSGRATRAREVRLGYLPQSVEPTGSVREAVFGSLPEHEWAGDARRRGVVTALLSGIGAHAALERLSGGERRRAALAALLLGRYDLLLLDEPTNHLDLEAIRWLAGYLREQAGAVVVVTHDRWFLDAVTERTWEVTDGQVLSYDGGYSAYVLARAERARLAEAADRRRRSLLRKELAWLRRGPPARTSKPKFRIEAATALIDDEPAPRDHVQLARIAAGRLGKTVIDVEDASVSAGERVLLDDVTWRLGPGDRVGVVGVNGSGKTTLLRLQAGALPVDGDSGRRSGRPDGVERPAAAGDQHGELVASGRVVRGKTVRLGYLTQEPGRVDPGLRALEAAQQVRSSARLGNREVSASQLLDLLGLRGDRQWTVVGELSGGEQRRLQLLMLLMAEPNVLLLDEPTNDLDIDTLTELEDLLDGWPGSLVVVSHDRYFLERVTDHVVALLDGKLSFLAGGVPEYLDRQERGLELAQGPPRQAAGPAAGTASAATASAGTASAGPGTAGPGTASAAARRRDGQKELTRLERQLSKISGQEAELIKALAEHAADYPALIELGAQLRAVQEEKASLEERWLTVAEELAE
jgi:ATP-binding cassette subfamily F protein uup